LLFGLKVVVVVIIYLTIHVNGYSLR